MEPIYWLTRQKEEAILASGAASAEARMVHHELANRYGVKASQAEMDAIAGLDIVGIPADQYWINGFRYTNTGNAIAEARRGPAQ